MSRAARSRPSRPKAPPAAPVAATPPPGRLPGLLWATAIGVCTLVAYYPALHGQFVLDDTWLLTDNPSIRASDGLWRFWNVFQSHDAWPMTNTTFWLEWRLWGMHPTGYHVTNLLLHLTTVGLLWAILDALSVPGAPLAAVLFAVHPVNVESVAWISQRKNLLALLFLLVAIGCFLVSEAQSAAAKPPVSRRADPWYGASLAAFVLAMLSKGSVAILPLLLLGIVAWTRAPARRDLWRSAPYFLVSAVLVPINMWLQARVIAPGARPSGVAERVLGAGAVVWFYLGKALLPVDLAFVYPRWQIRADAVQWWLPLLGAGAATAGLWRLRHTPAGRPLLFAWAYFCIALAPVLGFTDITFMEHSLVADHYQHIALIGVVAWIAAAWTWAERRSTAVTAWGLRGLAALVVGLLTGLAWRQSSLYVDSLTLYQASLVKNPASWMLRTNLCSVLIDTGRPQEALEHCTVASRVNPDSAKAQNNLGNALLATGRTQEAIDRLTEALRLQPDFPEAENNLGNALRDGGRPADAADHYRRALDLRPDYAAAHNNWGMALAKAGHLDDAIAHFEQALRLDPDSPKAHNNLGIALFQTGRLDEGIDHFERALQLDPGAPDAQRNLRAAREMR